MADDTLSTTLDNLSTSLDAVEATLAPLLARPLEETLASLEPVERAKVLFWISYTLHSSTWSSSGLSFYYPWHYVRY